MNIKTEIEYGATVAVEKERIDLSNGELMKWKKEKVAADLGRKIAEDKGWQDEHESGGLVMAEMRLYVFTPAELMTYMDAKFKARLQHMAATEGYLTDHQREALMIQSERF